MPTNMPQYKDEYQRLFDTCVIKESKYPEVDSYIRENKMFLCHCKMINKIIGVFIF